LRATKKGLWRKKSSKDAREGRAQEHENPQKRTNQKEESYITLQKQTSRGSGGKHWLNRSRSTETEKRRSEGLPWRTKYKQVKGATKQHSQKKRVPGVPTAGIKSPKKKSDHGRKTNEASSKEGHTKEKRRGLAQHGVPENLHKMMAAWPQAPCGEFTRRRLTLQRKKKGLKGDQGAPFLCERRGLRNRKRSVNERGVRKGLRTP